MRPRIAGLNETLPKKCESNNNIEIIWLLNLLNLNDKRYPVTVREVFDSKGAFVQNAEGLEIGKELLIQKMMGYISYVLILVTFLAGLVGGCAVYRMTSDSSFTTLQTTEPEEL